MRRLVGRGSAPAGPVSQTGHSGGGGAPLAGTRTCRQELADRRGWSTFSEARPAHRKVAERRAGGRHAAQVGTRDIKEGCATRRAVPLASLEVRQSPKPRAHRAARTNRHTPTSKRQRHGGSTMSAADFGRSAPPAPKRSPAPARPPMDPQFAARLRELQLKGLDVADGILDKLKGEQAPPAPPPLPLNDERRQMVNRSACRRSVIIAAAGVRSSAPASRRTASAPACTRCRTKRSRASCRQRRCGSGCGSVPHREECGGDTR